MDLKMEDVKELLDTLKDANEFLERANVLLEVAKPELPKYRELICKNSNEFYPLIESVAFTSVDLRAAMIMRLHNKHDFTLDQAIAIVNSQQTDMRQALSNIKR